MFADDVAMSMICALVAAAAGLSAYYAARSVAASFDAMRYAIKAATFADAALKDRRDAQRAAGSARADAILAGDAADDDPAQDWEPADVGAHI